MYWLIGVGVYLGATALALGITRAARPDACPLGHTDLYCLDGWKCKVCESRKFTKRLKRRLKHG